MGEWMLAVDFGDSNTAAAQTNPISGQIEALALSRNRTTVSSSVFITSPTQIAVGDAAANLAPSNPPVFAPAPKRIVSQGFAQAGSYEVPTAALWISRCWRLRLKARDLSWRGRPK